MPSTFDPWLREQPEAGYFSFQNQWKTPNAKKYFQGQFANIQNQYLGQLASQVRGGGEPTLDWMTKLRNIDWQQEFQEQTGGERRASTPRFNPFTRFIY